MMEHRKFGRTDIEVSPISFGCAAVGSRTSGKAAAKALSEALDQGINFYDTAPFYGQGESEKVLGKTFQARRQDVVLATKVGLYPSAVLRMAAKVKPLVRAALTKLPGPARTLFQKQVQNVLRSENTVLFSRDSMFESVEQSLKRLRTDYIDVLFLHVTPDPQSIDEAMGALKDLRAQGKIRSYGVSSGGVEQTNLWLNRRHDEIDAMQVRLSLFEIDTIEQCVPRAVEQQIAVVAREPFAQGKLLPAENNDGVGFLGASYDDRFEPVAKGLGATVPQLALSFLHQTPGVTTILTGMSSTLHVARNVESLAHALLADEQVRDVHRLGSLAS